MSSPKVLAGFSSAPRIAFSLAVPGH